jgi:hypothetical protein
MKSYRLILFILFLMLLVASPFTTVFAQTGEIALRIVAITSQGISFFEQDAQGILQAIGQPLSNFAVESLGGSAEWLILSEENFAASPDGQYIAFTAKSQTDVGLFIYTISTNTLIQQPITSYWLIPQWSPDSEAILLTSGFPYWGSLPVPDDYVYDVQSASLSQITFTEGRESAFHWSPDGDSLLYLGTCHPQVCGNPTVDLYLVSRDGTSRFPITDFPNQVSFDTSINVCHLEWDAANQRWYYVIGCGGSLDNPFTPVYSTDLSGTNQLVLDLETYLQSNDGLESDLHYGLVRGIHSRPDAIYFSVELEYFPDPNLHPEMAGVISHEWRVLRLTHQGQLETIYQEDSMRINNSVVQLTDSVISPSGQYIALLFHDSALVIDIINNQNVSVVPGLPDPAEKAVCDVQWLTSDTIIYNVGGRRCYGVDLVEPQAVWILDVVSNEVTVLTDGFTEPAWVLPFQEIIPMSAIYD